MDETTRVGDSTQKVSDSPENDLKQNYEKDRHDNIAYETYKKAISEKKNAAAENDALKARLAALEQDKMQAEGNKDELISALRKQLGETESKLKQDRSSYTWNVVGAQIKSELATRGVSDPDKALKFAAAVHKDDLSTVEVDDKYNVNGEDLKRFVDKFLNENQSMGFISKVAPKDLSPGKVEMTGHEDKKTSKMSDEEIMRAWREAQR